MIRICAWCKKKIGEKPPYEDRTETHGVCDKCLEKIREEVEGLKEEKKVNPKLYKCPGCHKPIRCRVGRCPWCHKKIMWRTWRRIELKRVRPKKSLHKSRGVSLTRRNKRDLFDKKKLPEFKMAYHRALQQGRDEFVFEGNEYFTPYAKRIIDCLDRQLRRSSTNKNPYSGRQSEVIYDHLTRIEARKGKHSMFPGERYYHNFKPGAMVIGLPNGDLLIKSSKGKKLWKKFDYPDKNRRKR